RSGSSRMIRRRTPPLLERGFCGRSPRSQAPRRVAEVGHCGTNGASRCPMVRRGWGGVHRFPFVVALLTALGCSASDDGTDEASGALTWSKDLFAMSNAPSGEFNAGDAYWMAHVSHLAHGEVQELLKNNYGALASVSELRVSNTGTEV